MSSVFSDNLPPKFVRIVLNLCGNDGEKWLDQLPQTIGKLENKWRVEAGFHFSNLSYNYVAKCEDSGGKKRVLKIALPLRKPEIFTEASALKAFSDCGAVKVLKVDKEFRAILLERLSPGNSLKELFDNDPGQAVKPAIKVLQRLSAAGASSIGFGTLEDWFSVFNRMEKTIFPKEYLRRAKRVLGELNADQLPRVLIHGDFHHENILSDSSEGFKVIDPKGVSGNLGYEISVFLNNHLNWIEDKEEIKNAVRKFSKAFGIPKETLRKWALVQLILSACWDFEDNGSSWKKDLEWVKFWY